MRLKTPLLGNASTLAFPAMSFTGRRSTLDTPYQNHKINSGICFADDDAPPADDTPPSDTPPSDPPPADDGNDAKGRLYGDDNKPPADDTPPKDDEKPKDDDTPPSDDKPKDDADPDAPQPDENGVYAPETYKLEFPESLGLKDEAGEPLQFVEGDPLVAQAQEIFSEMKINPADTSKLMGLYGKVMMDTRAGIEASQKELSEASDAAMQAEVAKLEVKGEGGKTTSGPVRIENLLNSFDNILGDGASQTLKSSLQTADQVIAFEKLVAKASGGNISTGGDTVKPSQDAATRFYGKKK